MAGYANPRAIVDVQWVAEHLENPDKRLVLADRHMNPAQDPRIPGSVVWRWSQDMQHQDIHDIPDKTMMEGLLGRSGIGNATTVVPYGGANNWYAAYAFWLLKIFGHENVRLMQGASKNGAMRATPPPRRSRKSQGLPTMPGRRTGARCQEFPQTRVRTSFFVTLKGS